MADASGGQPSQVERSSAGARLQCRVRESRPSSVQLHGRRGCNGPRARRLSTRRRQPRRSRRRRRTTAHAAACTQAGASFSSRAYWPRRGNTTQKAHTPTPVWAFCVWSCFSKLKFGLLAMYAFPNLTSCGRLNQCTDPHDAPSTPPQCGSRCNACAPRIIRIHPQVAFTPAERTWKEPTGGQHDALWQSDAVAGAEAHLPGSMRSCTWYDRWDTNTSLPGCLPLCEQGLQSSPPVALDTDAAFKQLPRASTQESSR